MELRLLTEVLEHLESSLTGLGTQVYDNCCLLLHCKFRMVLLFTVKLGITCGLPQTHVCLWGARWISWSYTTNHFDQALCVSTDTSETVSGACIFLLLHTWCPWVCIQSLYHATQVYTVHCIPSVMRMLKVIILFLLKIGCRNTNGFAQTRRNGKTLVWASS